MKLIHRIRTALATVMVAAFLVSPVAAVAVGQPAYARNVPPQVPEDCYYPILGIPPWFRGVVKVENNECIIESPATFSGGITGFIWRVALNVIEIGLFIVGFIALFFILYGGFQFLTGGANPSQIEKARMTLLNAVIGLAISMGAIAIVNLIFGIIN